MKHLLRPPACTLSLACYRPLARSHCFARLPRTVACCCFLLSAAACTASRLHVLSRTKPSLSVSSLLRFAAGGGGWLGTPCKSCIFFYDPPCKVCYMGHNILHGCLALHGDSGNHHQRISLHGVTCCRWWMPKHHLNACSRTQRQTRCKCF